MPVVAVLTSSRADLGPLRPVIEAIDAAADLRLLLLVCGTHASAMFGNTGSEIAIGPDSIREVFAADLEDATPGGLVAGGAKLTRGVERALRRHGAAALVVLGDRWELLYAVPPALLLNVPLVHLHGGEITEGALDERVRHAVTKLADLHLCASEDAARRILQMGEEPWRVLVTGAPSLDRFAQTAPAAERDLADLLGGPVVRPLALVTYHSPTVVDGDPGGYAADVLEACALECGSVIVTYPGLDPGFEAVLAAAEEAARRHDRVTLLRSLGPRYPAVLAAVDVVVGNSSSGVIEAASVRVPAVDVGDRQAGRLRGRNVIHAEEGLDAVRSAVRQALDPGFREGLAGVVNPYGDGKAVPRILDALRRAVEPGPRRKVFVQQAEPSEED